MLRGSVSRSGMIAVRVGINISARHSTDVVFADKVFGAHGSLNEAFGQAFVITTTDHYLINRLLVKERFQTPHNRRVVPGCALNSARASNAWNAHPAQYSATVRMLATASN
jgi:hypothetical protein